MFINKHITIFFLIISVAIIYLKPSVSNKPTQPTSAQIEGSIIEVFSENGKTIKFKNQNGVTKDGHPTESHQIPHLVLTRNGNLTEPDERTLMVELSGIALPPSGVTATLIITTQHVDPDQAGDSASRIQVWNQTQVITDQSETRRVRNTITFQCEFEENFLSGNETIRTPSDYYQIYLFVTDAQDPTIMIYSASQEYAFLLENQWVVALPKVKEAAPGAAPNELILFYLDMFPFRKDTLNGTNWLSREEVTGYIQDQLIPAMVEAFTLQTNNWGFPWYPEWTSYRGKEDQKRLSVSLADGETWYHGHGAGQGNLGMFINISQGKIEYETLTDGLLSTFHHELFHNHQRNIQQHYGGSGQVGGRDEAWNFFAEGIAVLASSVGQPEVQFTQSWGSRAYRQNATGFLGREGISAGDLKKSYTRLNPYHAVAYWRFLYEQCGGMLKGRENAAGGMQVIKLVLHSLYSGEIVNIDTTKDLVKYLPEIMDHALQAATCPFDTYQKSLTAFARSIYTLRLDGGRCVEPGIPEGCGFYDPNNLYYKPSVSKIAYTGEVTGDTSVTYASEIPNSFGIDIIEVDLDGSANQQALQIDIVTNGDSGAIFDVQFINPANHLIKAQQENTEVFIRSSSAGTYTYGIPESNKIIENRLAVIITRVDNNEDVNKKSNYTVIIRPTAE